MADLETVLRNKYNIPNLFPEKWPEEKDMDSDNEDAEATSPQLQRTSVATVSRSKSRYSVLESSGSFRRNLPGAEKGKDGVESMVSKDESDPLGQYSSVVKILKKRGLPVEDDVKLRNRFLLSSTTFSPSLFLSQVHHDASTDSLLSGLDFLSRSIEQKSASLKVLVESNFERFVSAKATIDRVYNEMRDTGAKELESPTGTRFSRPPGHSRVPSRSSFSSRKLSASGAGLGIGMGGQLEPAPNEKKKKNALVKESEYGVHGIKVPLTEVAVKAEEVWGPALGGREKEETLKSILTSVEKNRSLFEVGSQLHDAIRRKDHETIVEEYTRARRFADEARYNVQAAKDGNIPLTDTQVHHIIVTAKMWGDVEQQVDAFKHDCWKRLVSTHFTKHDGRGDGDKDQYMSLIKIMLELGVEENPIWAWLLSRYEYLKHRIRQTCERSTVEIEILRRHLSSAGKPSLRVLAKYLRSVPTNAKITVEPSKLDTPKVIEFWEHVVASMTALLSANGGLLGEVVEYWEIAQGFVTGRAGRSLPMGPGNMSSVHHILTASNVEDLHKGTTELVIDIRDHLFSFFSDPPIEDISLLFSPLPTTPEPTTPRTPLSAALSPTASSRFRFDPNNVPPPSPSRGETWEKYAFWPPHSNALSGSHYLSRTLQLIGAAANEMASLRLPATALGRVDEALRMLVGSVRERCMQAVCASWNTDAENLKVLEDWTRDADRKDITNLPSRFLAVQTFLLNNLQKIMYVSGGDGKSRAEVDVVVPPSSKLLQMVRAQFVASLYRTLSGMVELGERGRRALGKEFEVQSDDLTVDGLELEDQNGGGWGALDAEKHSIRLLLTLSNLSHLSLDSIPHLLTHFETLFSTPLPEETTRIRDVLSQLDAKIFASYTRPHIAHISRLIQTGVFSPRWAPPSAPGTSVAARDPSPFVFEVLLELVLVHTEVSTTSPPLTPRILRSLFESTTTALITTLEQPSFPPPSSSALTIHQLMQATLDVEFMAQTLSAYTTEQASQVQTAIYSVLDAKTDNNARQQLQNELGNLRGTLKALREGTRVQFLCFRRERRRGRTEGAQG